MNIKIAGLVLIAVGAGLVYLGYSEAQSLAGQFVEAVTGAPRDRTMHKYVAGGICAALGIGLVVFGGSKNKGK